MWIMVCGPYTTDAEGGDGRASNLRALNEAALAVHERGHVPVVGVNAALPIIEAAGTERYDEIMMPLSLALAERCDAALRVGGPSRGADAEVDRFRERGLPVYGSVADVPAA
jgi:hypothetical protein